MARVGESSALATRCCCNSRVDAALCCCSSVDCACPPVIKMLLIKRPQANCKASEELLLMVPSAIANRWQVVRLAYA